MAIVTAQLMDRLLLRLRNETTVALEAAIGGFPRQRLSINSFMAFTTREFVELPIASNGDLLRIAPSAGNNNFDSNEIFVPDRATFAFKWIPQNNSPGNVPDIPFLVNKAADFPLSLNYPLFEWAANAAGASDQIVCTFPDYCGFTETTAVVPTDTSDIKQSTGFNVIVKASPRVYVNNPLPYLDIAVQSNIPQDGIWHLAVHADVSYYGFPENYQFSDALPLEYLKYLQN